MTRAKILSQIKKALDEEKTLKDKISLLAFIKIMLEADLERLKRENNQRQMAYDAKTLIIKKALKRFLTALDKIHAKHAEVGDTDVREQMYRAVYRGFIQPQRDYLLPGKFGMFSDEGNTLVSTAMREFLTHPEVVVAAKKLKQPEDRFAAFQDRTVESTEGTTYSEYFGYSKQVRVA